MKTIIISILLFLSFDSNSQDTLNFDKIRSVTQLLSQSAQNRFEKPASADGYYNEAVKKLKPLFVSGKKYVIPIRFEEEFKVDYSDKNKPIISLYEGGEDVYPKLDIWLTLRRNTEHIKSHYSTKESIYLKLENLELEMVKGQLFYLLIEIVPSGYKAKTFNTDNSNVKIEVNLKILYVYI